MKHTYDEFRRETKKRLRENLAAHNLSDEDLENYVQQEEDQVKGAYEGYLHPRENDTREDDVRFMMGASSIAMCLEYCY